MSELEKYYTEEVKSPWMPVFNELSEEKLNILKNSLGFASYNMHNANQRLIEVMQREGSKIIQKINDNFIKAMSNLNRTKQR